MAQTTTTGLWKNDGTTAGTTMLHDFGALPQSRLPTLFSAGGAVYFVLPGANNVVDLWRSDGTPLGTGLVKEIAVAPNSPPPTDFTGVGSTAYFTVDDVDHGRELFETDGTAAGTRIVRDIFPGTPSADPQDLTSMNGLVYFTADDGVHGRELWRSDGTDGGTFMVKEIRPGGLGAQISGLTTIGNTLYFSASDGVSNQELWKSDGTASGTSLVADVDPGPASSSPMNLTNAGGTLFFSAFHAGIGVELWKSDGTASGTTLVKDISPGLGSSMPTDLVAAGSRVFFSADDGSGPSVWTSDGSAAGTVKLPITNPGTMIPMGSRVYFSYADSAHGAELWSSDGTIAGTGLVSNINPGSASSSPVPLATIGSTLLLSADDGFHGRELWKSDGTASGTALASDLNTAPLPGSVSQFFSAGGKLYYNSQDGEFYATDGSLDGATALGSVTIAPTQPVTIGATTYFSSWSGGASSAAGLWKTDGTAAGTSLVKSLSSVSNLVVYQGKVLFTAGNPGASTDDELWSSDGTAAGTVQVQPTSRVILNPSRLAVAGNEVYVVAENDAGPATLLWKTDGTSAGTTPVQTFDNITAIKPLADSSVLVLGGTHVWRTDGTAAGTIDLMSDGTLSADPGFLATMGQMGYYIARDVKHIPVLYRTDGTIAGTHPIAALGGAGDTFSYPTPLGSRLLFAQNTGMAPVELWSSDGTAGGTRTIGRFEDIGPSFAVVGSVAYFDANDALDPVGLEPWRSDGTTAGTMPAGDINPGLAASTSSILQVFNGSAAFIATDGIRGDLLWTASPSVAPPASVDSLTAVAGAPTQVTLSWHNNAADVSGIRVERSTASDFSDISGTYLLAPGATSYTDVLADPGVSVYYRVTAFNTAGSSIPTTASVDTPRSAGGLTQIMPAALSTNGVFVTFRHQSYFINAGYAYRTDGTTTTKLFDQIVDFISISPDGKSLYLGRIVNAQLVNWWSSDGTTQGTVVSSPPPSAPAPLPSAYPAGSVVVGNHAFYSSPDSFNNGQLWVTDGTPSGAVQLTSFANTSQYSRYVIRDLVNADGTIYFFVEAAGGTGYYMALWKSDGTHQGTVALKTLGSSVYGYNELTSLGSRVFFENGAALWTSNGTAAGTITLKSIGFYNQKAVDNLVVFDGLLYFATHLGTGQDPTGTPLFTGQLWSTDGTIANTVQVPLPLTTKVTGLSPSNLYVLDDQLLFEADAPLPAGQTYPPHFTTLYSYVPSSVPVPEAPSDISATAISGDEVDLSWVDNAAGAAQYLLQRSLSSTFDSIDKSVSLPPGTTSYADVGVLRGKSYFYKLVAFNRGGASVSVAADPVTVPDAPADPADLSATATGPNTIALAWTDNAATTETSQVLQRSSRADFALIDTAISLPAGTDSYEDSGLEAGTEYYYRLWSANNAGRSGSVVASTQTPALPSPAPADLQAHAVSSSRIDLTWTGTAAPGVTLTVERAVGDGAFALLGTIPTGATSYSDTSVNSPLDYRYRLRASNSFGSTVSPTTASLATIPPGATLYKALPSGVKPLWLTQVGGVTFFVSGGLWALDPAGNLTELLTGDAPQQLTGFNGKLFFVDTDSKGSQKLWESDGTTAGTKMVMDTAPGSSGVNIRILASLGNVLFFAQSVQSGSLGIVTRLWKTDGASSTVVVNAQLDLDPQQLTGSFAVSNGLLYFPVIGSQAGTYLYATDANGNTHRVSGLPSPDDANNLTDVNGTLYFVGNDSGNDAVLYKVDSSGAASAIRNFGYLGGRTLSALTALNGKLYFFYVASYGASPSLWVSDGTTAGTQSVAAMPDAPGISLIGNSTAANGIIYFELSQYDGSTNIYTNSLWRTDGSAAGTFALHVVDTIYMPPPSAMLQAGNLLFFNDGQNLWRSDGTVAGTYAVATSTTQYGSPLGQATVDGTDVIFVGADGSLHAASPVAPGAPSGLTVTAAGNGNVLTWTDNSNNESAFVIDRSTTADFAVVDATFVAPANATGFTDATATAGTQYYYRVRAFNAGGYSGTVMPASRSAAGQIPIFNVADYLQFKRAYGSRVGQASYDSRFDFDGNGVINNTDYLVFKSHFGRAAFP